MYAKIVYVGFGFFLLFAGHAAFRSLLPAIRPTTGPWLVALNFTAYALGSLLHPQWLANYKRLFFTISALAHSQWIALLQFPIDESIGFAALAGTSSIINGFGAGALWICVGSWMAEIVAGQKDVASKYNSIFLFFYGISGVVGNIVAACTIAYDIPIFNVVWYLFAISLSGSCWLLFTPHKFLYVSLAIPIDEFESANTEDEENGESTNKLSSTRWSLIKALFTETMFPWMLSPLVSLSAVSAMTWVTLPITLPINIVPIAFIGYAVASATGPLIASRLSVYLEWIWVFITFIICTIICCIALMIAQECKQCDGYSALICITIFIFGIVIGGFNNIIYTVFTSLIKRESKITSLADHLPGEAYCMDGFFYCIFFALFSAISLPLFYMSLLVIVLLSINIIVLLIYGEKINIIKTC
jgi:MFS family permease